MTDTSARRTSEPPVFTVRAERPLIRPDGSSVRHLLVQVTAPQGGRRARRPPVNVALVLDRSGSMSGDKLRHARAAAAQAIRCLDETDRVSVVVYDTTVEVLVPSTHATADARRRAEKALDRIEADNTTALFDGWLAGCEQVAAHLETRHVGRCLLLTDGLANVGVTDADTIAHHAGQLRERHVSTTTFGVGEDFDEGLLRRMAEAGGGNFYFIEAAAQIPDLLNSELGEALDVVARRAAIALDLERGVEVSCLNDFPVTRAPGGAAVALGDLVSRQELSLVLRVAFPAGHRGARCVVGCRVSDADGVLAGEGEEVAFTYGSHDEVSCQPRDRAVDRAVARVYAARAAREGLEANRAGDTDRAAEILRACRRKIRSYAGDDPELHAIMDDLFAKQREYGAPMGSFQLKFAYYASERELRTRDARGAARRAPTPKN